MTSPPIHGGLVGCVSSELYPCTLRRRQASRRPTAFDSRKGIPAVEKDELCLFRSFIASAIPKRLRPPRPASTPKLPADLKVHLTVTSDDRSTVICLWEAPSVDKVRDVVEAHLGHASKNEYIPIDPAKSMGLPATAAARA